jgi:hypothetical protein
LRFFHRQPAPGRVAAATDCKRELIGRAAPDRDEAIVVPLVVATAQQDQVRRIVRSAVLAMHDVVDLEKSS